MPQLPVLEPAELPSDAVEVGRITDAWGVKGWFKVLPYSSDPEALFASRSWFLQPAQKGGKSFFSGTVLLPIRQARTHSDSVVAWAQGVDDRDAAEALRGARHIAFGHHRVEDAEQIEIEVKLIHVLDYMNFYNALPRYLCNHYHVWRKFFSYRWLHEHFSVVAAGQR